MDKNPTRSQCVSVDLVNRPKNTGTLKNEILKRKYFCRVSFELKYADEKKTQMKNKPHQKKKKSKTDTNSTGFERIGRSVTSYRTVFIAVSNVTE